MLDDPAEPEDCRAALDEPKLERPVNRMAAETISERLRILGQPLRVPSGSPAPAPQSPSSPPSVFVLRRYLAGSATGHAPRTAMPSLNAVFSNTSR